MTDLQSLITAAETGTTDERAKALCELGGMALELAKRNVKLQHILSCVDVALSDHDRRFPATVRLVREGLQQ